jgi:hypothetical protein
MNGCASIRKDIETSQLENQRARAGELSQPLEPLKEVVMTKRESTEYRARLANDAGVIRGKIPSPLVRDLGGRPGDYMIFRSDESGRFTVSVSRSKAGAKKSAKGSKARAKKSGR